MVKAFPGKDDETQSMEKSRLKAAGWTAWVGIPNAGWGMTSVNEAGGWPVSLPKWPCEVESRGGEVGGTDSRVPFSLWFLWFHRTFIHQGAWLITYVLRQGMHAGTFCRQGIVTCSGRIMEPSQIEGRKRQHSTYFLQNSVTIEINHWRKDSNVKVLSTWGSASVLRIAYGQKWFF